MLYHCDTSLNRLVQPSRENIKDFSMLGSITKVISDLIRVSNLGFKCKNVI